MANNRTYDEGRTLYEAVSPGTISGSPVAVGSRCGVALTNRDAAGNATVDHRGVYVLTVTGATVPGTPIYYTENPNPSLRLGVVATALFFGYALAAQAGPGPGQINVVVAEASGISQVPAGTLEGTTLANVADANVIGGIPVLHRIAVAGGAAGNTDVLLTHKTRVLDVWAVHTAAGEADDTIQVFSAADAITDPMDWSGADTGIVRAGQINDANQEIAAGGTLRVTTTDNDAGDDVGAGVVYVLGIRVA